MWQEKVTHRNVSGEIICSIRGYFVFRTVTRIQITLFFLFGAVILFVKFDFVNVFFRDFSSQIHLIMAPISLKKGFVDKLAGELIKQTLHVDVRLIFVLVILLLDIVPFFVMLLSFVSLFLLLFSFFFLNIIFHSC